MIIKRAKVYGMCFGVRDAISTAEKAAQNGPVTVLGQLVHNPVVVAALQTRGVRVAESVAEEKLERGKNYVITAHGVSNTQREAWQQTGATLHDTTCPLVRKAHDRLREFVAAGLHPVVIGKPGHVEVRGLTGDYPDATVIETEADVLNLPYETDLGIVSQTTQPPRVVNDLVAAIRRVRPRLRVFFADTVCQPTRDRQEALRELCNEVRVIIVVGGRHSNNTKQLVLAAREYGAAAHQIERAEELQQEWFDEIECVGLTAGTSTPDGVIDAVEKRIQRLAGCGIKGGA